MFAVIHIPNFHLQAALRLEPELRTRAVALVGVESAKSAVVQVTTEARQRGVMEGQTASQATARCAGLLIRNRSTAQEEFTTEALLQIACAFSPNIEATGVGICTMELKGLGLENDSVRQQLAAKIVAALAQVQLDAQIGFGPTPGLALIIAQSANPILLVKNPRSFVLDLPIEALRPPPEVANILTLWGIRTIGAFLELGKDNLAERLGPAAAALFDDIDLARPLKIVPPPESFAEGIEFQHEIETTEPLLFVLHRFVEQLARRLEMIYLVVAELEMRLHLSSGAVYVRKFKVPSPTNNIQVLFRMLQTHLETLRTDAPIVALKLEAQPGRAEQHQFGLFETSLRDPNQFAETLARLTALCGSENVGTAQLEATHRPDAFRVKVPNFCQSFARTENANGKCMQTGMQLRRFRPALSALIQFREHRPSLIHSQRFNGPIKSAGGPFLASGDWWVERGWAREEWDVEMADGALCRIFRSAEGCFIEGVYD